MNSSEGRSQLYDRDGWSKRLEQVFREADAQSLSAELTAGSLQDDTTET